MPRSIVNLPHVNFTGGLVTEATGLSFPENTARDLDNVDLDISGKIRRRLGLREEVDGLDMVGGGFTFTNTEATSVHVWRNPGGKTDIDFVVFQVGRNLIIREMNEDTVSDITAIAALSIVTTIDYAGWTYDSPTAEELDEAPLEAVSGFGRLWMVGPHTYPFYLEYDADVGNITIQRDNPEIRDFNGIDPREQGHTGTITNEHLYNLINQGWTIDLINQHFVAAGTYPDSSEQWFLGKDTNDNYSTTELHKLDSGESLAPNGKFVLNALDGDKNDYWTFGAAITTTTDAYVGGNSGPHIADANDERADHGGAFTACTFHQGRLWLAGDQNPKRPNGVYFSRTIQKPKHAMQFRQENDPTSETFSDLLDTDGGVIYINGAGHILALESFQEGVLVFASNGIWFIRGGETGFTPSGYAVDKISDVAVSSTQSVILAEDAILFWAIEGIYGVTADLKVQPVSDKIRTFYNDELTEFVKQSVVGEYDRLNKKAIWVYNPNTGGVHARSKLLILDTRLGAFSKYSLDLDVADFNITVAVPSARTIYEQRTTPSGLTSTSQFAARINLQFLLTNPITNQVRLGEFIDDRFQDYVDLRAAGVNFVSFLETGHNHVGDLARIKQSPYVHSFFDATEEASEFIDPDWIIYPQSQCLVTFKWDWQVTSTGNRWSRPQQAYRRRRPITPLQVDNGEGVVYTKLKARGKGKALSIRYESVDNFDFRLLGFNVELIANAK